MTRETEKGRAFRLLEEGDLPEALEIAEALMQDGAEPELAVLAATALHRLGRNEEAEAYLRDLARRLPEASYLHSLLGRVLAARGDERATAEFAEAIRLDPDNPEALREYAGYLAARGDHRAAAALGLRLTAVSSRPEDRLLLARSLIAQAEFEEAVRVLEATPPLPPTIEAARALLGAGLFRRAADVAAEAFEATGDMEFLRAHLGAWAVFDPEGAALAYQGWSGAYTGIDFDRVLLLKTLGRFGEALEVARSLAAADPAPYHRLLEAELTGLAGDRAGAEAAAEMLVLDLLGSLEEIETLECVLRRYEEILLAARSPEQALARYLEVVGSDPTTVGLVRIGEAAERQGDVVLARDHLYRAYRTDFIRGGLAYARFLARQDDLRECEKVMLYCTENATKTADLERVAEVALDAATGMHRLPRLLDRLADRLAARRDSLSSFGQELAAVALLARATDAFEAGRFDLAKECCLIGLDLFPIFASDLRLDDFGALFARCKEEAVLDRPVLGRSHTLSAAREPPAPPPEAALALSPEESRVVAFLREHRSATEHDLRAVLGTRRVAGLVNRLIRRAGSQGMSLIERKGAGDEGEEYVYVGR
ncbi:MAG: tetratricopeptide repeat protein [Methanospirillum sp.]|nr:tetratricopeptide repeat protein [Methanospirillum sp.]